MRLSRTVSAIVIAVCTVSFSPALAPAQPAAPAATPAAQSSTADVQAAIAKADQQIAKGLAFLKSKQNEDGSWGTANEPPAITALALRCFARNDQQNDPAVAKGYAALLAFQKPDGGIYRDILGNYNTSIAVSALTAKKDPACQPQIEKAVAYLKGIQFGPAAGDKPATSQPTAATDPFFGGWGYGSVPAGRTERPDLSNAQITLDALHDACIPTSDPAYQRALAFLTRCQNLKATNDQVWVSDDGGFVYGPGADRQGDSEAGEYIDANGKRLVRSYGSMTYAGLKSMIYAGLTKDDPRVQAAVAWLGLNWTLDENPGMKLSSPDAAKHGLYYYYSTMARALSARGEPTLPLADGKHVDWRVELINKLQTLQKDDGSWIGERRWMESNPILVTSYAVQALEEARDELKRQTR